MKIFRFKKIMSLLMIGAVLLPNFAFAEFNPNYIISDEELVDYNSMSLSQIQRFIETKGGALAWYVTTDTDGITRPSAEIIWRVAQVYKINPRVLLVTLQKEQSLVADQDPVQAQYDWATGYGVCDSCSLNDPDIQKY